LARLLPRIEKLNKPKYIATLARYGSYWLGYYINSDDDPLLSKDPETSDCGLIVDRPRHGFLTWDYSYLYTDDPQAFPDSFYTNQVGQIHMDLRVAVCRAILVCPVLTPKNQQRILGHLSNNGHAEHILRAQRILASLNK
jgi:hypothetical protein